MTNVNSITAGGASVSVSADLTQLKKDLSPGNPALKAIKQQFGEQSTFGELGKVAMGAGAVAGLALLGRAASEASSAILELNAAWHAGKISVDGYIDGIARGVPVLGEFWQLGRNIREGINGEVAAMDAAAKAQLNLNAAREHGGQLLRAGDKALKDVSRQQMKSLREDQQAGAGSEQEKRDIGALSDFEQAIGQQRDLTKSRLDALKTAADPLIERLGAAKADIESKKTTSETRSALQEEVKVIEASMIDFKERRKDIIKAGEEEELHLKQKYNRAVAASNEQAMTDAHEHLAEVDHAQKELKAKRDEETKEWIATNEQIMADAHAIFGGAASTTKRTEISAAGAFNPMAVQSLQVRRDEKIIKLLTDIEKNQRQGGLTAGP